MMMEKDRAVSTHALKRPKNNRWLLVSLIVLVLVVGGAGYYYYTRLQANKNNNTGPETSIIRTGDIILSATGPGTLIPGEEVSFGFKNSGQVSEVLVNLGDKVEADQVLARLDSTTMELQYKQAAASLEALSSPSQLAAAEQAVQDAKQSFATARNDLQYMIGPEMLVAQEEVANAKDNLQLAQATAQKDASDANKHRVSEAQAALDKAQETLNYAYYNFSNTYTLQTFRFRTITPDGSTSARKILDAPTEAEIAGAQAAYALAKANLTDAQNYLDILQGKQTTDNVPASSKTSITDANIALDQAKADLDATELIAPISGTVTSIDLNAGQDVGTSAVVTISNVNQPYTIDTYLDETDWDKAKVGYTASITFDLLPNKSFPGKITQVYPALDDSSGTSQVHILVQLDNQIDVDLPAGASGSVDVTGGQALGVLLVPTSALKETDSGTYVVYLMRAGKAVEQEVEIGLQDILNAEVKSGLQRGDIVLTNATDYQQ